MILVFIILGIIIFINLLLLILVLSNIKLEIKKLHISNENKNLQIDFILDLSIFAFNKFKIAKFTIDKERIKNFIQTCKINVQILKDNDKINKDIIKNLKYIGFKIEKFKIDGYFATFNPVLSGNIYVLLNSILPIFIAPKIKGKYINNIQFLNINENIINANLNCIINVKIVNIINTLHFLKNKGGKENNGKSSNRRSYAYSNE